MHHQAAHTGREFASDDFDLQESGDKHEAPRRTSFVGEAETYYPTMDTFWLVSALAVNGRRVEEARELFERVIAPSNDLGPLSEEYDVKRQRQVGNFPGAFSHL